MRLVFLASAAALITSAVVATPAFSQVAPAQQQTAKPDPNEVVCEKQEETGTRLGAKRVCKTRSQWAEQRRIDRLEIDRVQTQRNCGSGEGNQC
ncbi:MAG TPA: hypothetical protein VIV07_07120 [Sphingomicrobium sp.]